MNRTSAIAIAGNEEELLIPTPMIGKQQEALVSLYVHIPFCTRKCDYCHFYVLPDQKPLKISLMDGLSLEWSSIKPLLQGKKIGTLYFGGGTPYLLGASAVAEIIGWIAKEVSREQLQCMEITLEANPENIEPTTLNEYLSAGINRLSIGLQSLDDHLLTALSRRHNASKAIQAVEMAYATGFNNISVDLMYDLPRQDLPSWERTLQRAALLPISHLSLYNLTIEPQTVFFKYRNTLSKQLPDDETSKNMYETACQHFEEAGLEQYEISAFARRGFIAQHNSGYWTGRPFLGLGPSAFSYWEGSRFRNIAHLGKYVKALQGGNSPIDFSEKLPLEAHQRELLTIALRLLRGVNLPDFEGQEGTLSEDCKHTLRQLVEDGYLENHDNHYRLTRQGILFYDSVAAELI